MDRRRRTGKLGIAPVLLVLLIIFALAVGVSLAVMLHTDVEESEKDAELAQTPDEPDPTTAQPKPFTFIRRAATQKIDKKPSPSAAPGGGAKHGARPKLGPEHLAVVVPVRVPRVPSELVKELLAAVDQPHPLFQLRAVVIVVPASIGLIDHLKELAVLQTSHKHGKIVNIVRYVPPHDKPVCLAGMVNAAEATLHFDVSLMMTLSPAVTLMDSPGLLLSSLVNALRRERGIALDVEGPRAKTAIAGCGMVKRVPRNVTSTHAQQARVNLNPFEIVQHGYSVFTSAPGELAADGQVDELRLIRRLAGYSGRDARTLDPATEVDAVSLDCALLDRFTFTMQGGLNTTGATIVDLAMHDDAAYRFEDNLMRYIYRTTEAQDIFRIVNIQEAATAQQEARKAMSATLDHIVRHADVMESKLPRGMPLRVPDSEKQMMKSLRSRFEAERVSPGVMQEIQRLVLDAWSLLQHSMYIAGEDERSFEYSLDLLVSGHRVVVANVSVIVDVNETLKWLPANVVNFGVSRYFDYYSYVVSLRFSDKFRAFVHERRTMPLVDAEFKAQTRVQGPPLRIIWDFYCCKCCGFANEVQDLVYALQPYIDVNVANRLECFCGGAAPSVVDSLDRAYLSPFRTSKLDEHDQVVFVIHRQPTQYRIAYREQFGQFGDTPARQPRYVIGRSMYEFDRIATRWVNATRTDIDEVWVPAKWVRDVFVTSGVNASKVFVVPEAIDTSLWDPAVHPRIEWPTPSPSNKKLLCNRKPSTRRSRFTFFSDFKWEPRKGWDVLFNAYAEAFDEADDVALYVLTNLFLMGTPRYVEDPHNATHLTIVINQGLLNSSVTDRLDPRLSAPEWPTFCVMVYAVDQPTLVELYNTMDAFVLPTRGEGWGLPIIQAMAMGKPAIATGFGGQTEFMRPDNSFTINFTTTKLPVGNPYSREDGNPDQMWAEPSVESTVQHMRAVVRDRRRSAAVGAAARAYVRSRFSYDAVARVVVARLQHVRRNILSGVNMREPALPPPPPTRTASLDPPHAHPDDENAAAAEGA